MNRKKYFEVREDLGIQNQLNTYLGVFNEICEVYAPMKNMSISEFRDYLKQMITTFENKIQEQLNVE